MRRGAPYVCLLAEHLPHICDLHLCFSCNATLCSFTCTKAFALSKNARHDLLHTNNQCVKVQIWGHHCLNNLLMGQLFVTKLVTVKLAILCWKYFGIFPALSCFLIVPHLQQKRGASFFVFKHSWKQQLHSATFSWRFHCFILRTATCSKTPYNQDD